jgi:hypothetical protein
MSFFDKSKIDSDKVSEYVSSLDDLASSVETFRDELDSYKDEIASAKSDLEDAETTEELQKVISTLRDISVPDGCDNLDATPDGIADDLDSLESEESEFDAWSDELLDLMQSAQRGMDGVGLGMMLPSRRDNSNYSMQGDAAAKPALVRPGEAHEVPRQVPMSGEVHHWITAVEQVATRSAGIACTDGDLLVAKKEELTAKLLDLATEFAVYRHSTGTLLRPTDQSALALMWLVDDILQAVQKASKGLNATRVVVTDANTLAAMRQRIITIRDKFSEGVDKISESIPTVQ